MDGRGRRGGAAAARDASAPGGSSGGRRTRRPGRAADAGTAAPRPRAGIGPWPRERGTPGMVALSRHDVGRGRRVNGHGLGSGDLAGRRAQRPGGIADGGAASGWWSSRKRGHRGQCQRRGVAPQPRGDGTAADRRHPRRGQVTADITTCHRRRPSGPGCHDWHRVRGAAAPWPRRRRHRRRGVAASQTQGGGAAAPRTRHGPQHRSPATAARLSSAGRRRSRASSSAGRCRRRVSSAAGSQRRHASSRTRSSLERRLFQRQLLFSPRLVPHQSPLEPRLSGRSQSAPRLVLHRSPSTPHLVPATLSPLCCCSHWAGQPSDKWGGTKRCGTRIPQGQCKVCIGCKNAAAKAIASPSSLN